MPAPETLPSLLSRIRDGVATDADRLRARALVELDGTLPSDVREIALASVNEAADDAVALLALLGLEPLLADPDADDVDVAADVMAALGVDEPVPVAEAVHFEAGTIDIADRVMAQVVPWRTAVEVDTSPRPAAVNTTRAFRWAAVAVAAAAAVALVLGRGPITSPTELRFAQAGDLVVEDLTYAEGVQVVQLESADGSVILWVDDGEV